MIWIPGTSAFNCRTHCTPFMPGKLMSISTTSGRTWGRSFRASSALAYWLRQRKPSARLSTRARVARNLSLSSTMETEMDMADFLNGVSEGNGQAHNRSGLRSRTDRKFSVNVFHSSAHVAESVSRLCRLVVQSAQATPVVLDAQRKLAGLQSQSNPDFRCLRVFDHIVDGFLEGKKNVVADFRWNGDDGQLGRHLSAITQAGQREVF